MESKFVVFLVFSSFTRTILVHSQGATQSSTIYGLSSEATVLFNKVGHNQKLALQAKTDTADLIFDLLQKLAAISTWDFHDKVHDVSDIIAKSLIRAKAAVDYIINSIPIVVGKVCYAVEPARNASYADLDYLSQLISTGLKLAGAKNYSETRNEIESTNNASRKCVEHLIGNVYDGLRNCLNTTDPDKLATIKSSENGSALALDHAINSIFNGIKAFATAGHKDAAVIRKIDAFRSLGLIALRAEVEHTFSLLKALIIDANQHQIGITQKIQSIQYAQVASYYRNVAGVDIIFNTIKHYLTRLCVGYSDEGEDDFTPTDAAREMTNAHVKAAFRVLLDSILITSPDSSTAVAAAWEYLAIYTVKASKLYYDTIVFAQERHESDSDARSKIKKLEQKGQTIMTKGGYIISDLIRNNRSRDQNIEAEVKSLGQAAVNSLKDLNGQIFVGINILANASIDSCYNQSSAIKAAITRSNAVIDSLTHSRAEARNLLLQCDSRKISAANWTGAPVHKKKNGPHFPSHHIGALLQFLNL